MNLGKQLNFAHFCLLFFTKGIMVLDYPALKLINVYRALHALRIKASLKMGVIIITTNGVCS
jgi:hypothetical protein